MHPQFGGDVSWRSFFNALQTLLAAAPSMLSANARLIMTEEYHKQFGIASHDDTERPLSLVAMYAAEDPVTGSLLDERLKEFADLDIRRVFGLSITEFLDMPHDMCESIVNIARPRRQKETEAAEKALRELTGGGGGKIPGT